MRKLNKGWVKIIITRAYSHTQNLFIQCFVCKAFKNYEIYVESFPKQFNKFVASTVQLLQYHVTKILIIYTFENSIWMKINKKLHFI